MRSDTIWAAATGYSCVVVEARRLRASRGGLTDNQHFSSQRHSIALRRPTEERLEIGRGLENGGGRKGRMVNGIGRADEGDAVDWEFN